MISTITSYRAASATYRTMLVGCKHTVNEGFVGALDTRYGKHFVCQPSVRSRAERVCIVEKQNSSPREGDASRQNTKPVGGGGDAAKPSALYRALFFFLLRSRQINIWSPVRLTLAIKLAFRTTRHLRKLSYGSRRVQTSHVSKDTGTSNSRHKNTVRRKEKYKCDKEEVQTKKHRISLPWLLVAQNMKEICVQSHNNAMRHMYICKQRSKLLVGAAAYLTNDKDSKIMHYLYASMTRHAYRDGVESISQEKTTRP